MSQNAAAITVDQLRNEEIVAADLLRATTATPGGRRTSVSAASTPLSVFGRKMAGHGS